MAQIGVPILNDCFIDLHRILGLPQPKALDKRMLRVETSWPYPPNCMKEYVAILVCGII